jgi:aryl-alcohol dehydrogenase-like predicted oxidoreductase
VENPEQRSGRVEYRHLGGSGLRVSEISLGSWLTYGRTVDREGTRAIVRRACERGINLFDTANVYHSGAAEEVLGELLQEFTRSDLVVATKVYFPVGEGPNDRGLSRKHITEQCHASLRRLRTDYIDLYQCHRFDTATPLEETLRALDDLVTQGKVLYLGTSEWTAAQLAEAAGLQRLHGWNSFVSNQPQYSMLVRRIEAEVIPISRRLGIGQIVWSPLAQGVLTGKYRPGQAPPAGSRASDDASNMFMEGLMRDEVLSAVQRLRPIADELELSVAQLALAWTLRLPNVASAIVGASRPQQVDDNTAASGVRLDDEVLARIDRALNGVTA